MCPLAQSFAVIAISHYFLFLASQNMQLIGYRISEGSFYFSFCYWLIILGVVLSPIMWLGSPKNMKSVNISNHAHTRFECFSFLFRFGRLICSISVVTVLLVSCLIWVCILLDQSLMPATHFRGIQLDEPNYLTMLQVYGMIAFQFDIHPMLMTIEVDMTQKRKIGKVVCWGLLGKPTHLTAHTYRSLNGVLSLTVTCSLSIITTFLAAYKYGTSVTANVLEILPRSHALYVAILLVTLQLCLSSAVGHSAMFQHVEDWMKIPKGETITIAIMLTIDWTHSRSQSSIGSDALCAHQ